MLIAFITVALLATAMYFITIKRLFKNEATLITYSPTVGAPDTITREELLNQVERIPTAPSAAMASVITSATPSPTSIQAPEIPTIDISLAPSHASDFGDGWGNNEFSEADSGSAASAEVTFFDQTVTAKRIAYVVDYSLSMKGEKIELLRKELARSVAALPNDLEYQIICFAGPTWVAGDEVIQGQTHHSYQVKSDGKEYGWITFDKPFNFRPTNTSNTQEANWIISTNDNRLESIEIIQNTPMAWGTVWSYPLEMALNMSPQPDVIYFMTDGLAGTDSFRVANTIGEQAAKKDIIINTVSLMKPEARNSMQKMADLTRGVYSLIKEVNYNAPLKN